MAQTQQATVTAKYVNWPKDGKRFGSIKTPEGEMYWGEKPQLDRIAQGSTVTFEWEPQTWGEKPVKVIKLVHGTSQPTPAPANGQAAPAPRPMSNSAPVKDEEAIFVTGVVGRAMGSGQFTTQDVKLLTLAAAEAYREWKNARH